MRSISKIIAVLLAVFVLGACQDFDQLVLNKNLPSSSPPALLLTGALEHLNDQNAWVGKQGSMSAAQFFISTYDYYGTNNYDQAPFTRNTNNFEYLAVLENLQRMDLEARAASLPELNVYSAMGKFLRAYYFNLMSQKLGDLPLSMAFKGVDEKTPIYDTQKDVYIQILKWLEESNADLTQLIEDGISMSGDIYLNNDLKAWQKAVNAFTLRVLVSLSKKENEAGLDVKAKFTAILSNPTKYPLMTSIKDNVKYTYSAAFNNYPKNPTGQGRDAHRENIASGFLDATTALKDPRTFIAATPAPELVDGDAPKYTFDQFEAYVGAPAGLSIGELGVNAQGGKYSFVNALRYYVDFAGSGAEPAIIIGYPELCFNIAEGINRNWTAGDAAAWYLKGINASMEFFGLYDGARIAVGNNLSTRHYGEITVDLTAYLAQPAVVYKGGTDGLKQILTQKYIAFWQNSNWEAFFNQRRTGVPTLSTGPGNGNGGKIAVRWQYPVAEGTANGENYKTAVSRQFNGVDDLNGVLWILK
jgi:hypothetical protein